MAKGMGNLMKQAQQMQAKMAELQEQLADLEVHGAAGGDMVQVTMNGKGVLVKLTIKPEVVDAEDVGMLEDLIVAAVTKSQEAARTRVSEEMQKLTGGLNLPPGMSLPL
ncbi:YbaB/EbfC family nucleoid-associated protein [bacterium]|nr:YbaB/EbfC family nucleoid-associated protein [bacterium]